MRKEKKERLSKKDKLKSLVSGIDLYVTSYEDGLDFAIYRIRKAVDALRGEDGIPEWYQDLIRGAERVLNAKKHDDVKAMQKDMETLLRHTLEADKVKRVRKK